MKHAIFYNLRAKILVLPNRNSTMRVLLILKHLSGNNGWSRYGRDLAQQLDSKGHKVICLVHQEINFYLEQRQVLGSPSQYFANPLRSYNDAQKVRKAIVDLSPDIVHFLVEPYLAILPFLRVKNCKIFLTIHGTYAFVPNLLAHKSFKRINSSLIFKYAYNKVDNIISVSNHTKRYFLDCFPKSQRNRMAEKVTVITNGIELQNQNKIYPAKKSENIAKQILFVGAVKQRKGLLEAIEALKIYKESYSNKFMYNIAGTYANNKEYVAKLKHKISEYGLEKHVVFYGEVSEEKIEDLYNQAHLFLMLPVQEGRKFEGFGLVYLEANARGVPCIGSKYFGIPEAIKHGETGYLIDPNNPPEIAEKIDRVLNRKTISPKPCLNWAKQNNFAFKADQILQLYERANKT